MKAPGLVLLVVIVLAFASATAQETERLVFAFRDADGQTRFTSDPAVAAASGHRAPSPGRVREGSQELAESEETAIAASLQTYLVTYAPVPIPEGLLSFDLDLTPGTTPASRVDRAALRQEAARAELLVTVDEERGPELDSLLHGGLASLVFPALRAVYPRAALSVTVHDGVRTLCRSDWEPWQTEPVVRVR